MAVDPTDPETFDDEGNDGAELDVEAPENDAAAQQAELAPEQDEPVAEEDILRANEADLAEQARVVSLDEDDYR